MTFQQMVRLRSEVSCGAVGKLKEDSGYSKMPTMKASVMAVTSINPPARPCWSLSLYLPKV